MTVYEMAKQGELEVKTAADQLEAEVTGGYAADLISAVMANAQQGNVWVTWHTHPNIVAAALVTKLSAIVLVCGRQPEEETIRKAEQEHLPILLSKLPAFEIIGRLHGVGISGVQ
jgi:hypothetical protein